MKVSQIVAASFNNVIGINNDLPWKMPNDTAYFKEITSGHHIVMGRRNYEAEGKVLPGRVNMILTRNRDYKINDSIVVHKMEEAIETAQKAGEKELFIVGRRRNLQAGHAFYRPDLFNKDSYQTKRRHFLSRTGF